MGRRYILHSQDRLFLGFFLDFLLFGDFHCGRRHVQVIEVHVHIGHIRQFRKIHAPLCHGIKCFLHTVMAEIHAAGHGYHGAGLALRPPAHVTHLFIAVFFLLFVFIFTMAGCLHILGILFLVQVSSPLC